MWLVSEVPSTRTFLAMPDSQDDAQMPQFARATSHTIRGESLLGEQGVDEVAGKFGVSPWVIKHQVKNHGIAEVQKPLAYRLPWSS